MSFLAQLARVTQPLKGYRLLRRLLAEQRAQRHALERIADALELGQQPRESVQGQVFRSYSHTREPASERDLKDLTEVSYVDANVLGGMLAKEDELRAILGRDPSEQEIERAYRGEIE